MLFPPKSLSARELPPFELEADKETINKYEDCGLSRKALYVGAFGLPRRRYIPIGNIKRVYKRLAVSKGFFDEGKMYATISYLVVIFDKDKEKVLRFTREENLDALLKDISTHTKITVGKPNK